MRKDVLVAYLVIALVGAFSFGSIVHAVVPHDHSGGEAVWQELHAALRHEGKNIILVSATLSFAVVLPILISIRLTSQPVPLGRFERHLHRGIAKHRRFD